MHSALWISDYVTCMLHKHYMNDSSTNSADADQFPNHSNNHPITPVHVLMLTYLAHAYTLAIIGRPLFRDNVEAWKYGPIIPVVHGTISNIRENTIHSLYYCGTGLNNDYDIKIREIELSDALDDKEKEIIDSVVKSYGSWTGGEILTLVREEGTPWSKHYVEGHHNILPDKITHEYYSKRVAERQTANIDL